MEPLIVKVIEKLESHSFVIYSPITLSIHLNVLSATRKPIGYRRNEQEKGNPTLTNQIPRSMQSIPTIEKKTCMQGMKWK